MALPTPSILGNQPHPLVESSLASPHIQPRDRYYISPDGQISESLFRYAADKASLDEQDAVGVLFDEGEFRADEWNRLTSSVVGLLQDQMEGYASGESLIFYLEVSLPSLGFGVGRKADLDPSPRPPPRRHTG